MNRRDLIKAFAAMAPLTVAGRVWAAPATDAKLLVVFLRGAYDAVNVLVPVSSDFYYHSRPTLGIARPDIGNPNSALSLTSEWGLHPALRDGIFPFHHFHSTAHEVLGIAAGTAGVVLGGPQGRRFELSAGDVVVLPAGTGHRNVGSSSDLLVVGAYPDGMRWDLRRGDPGEHDEVLANIERVPIPDEDPVHGGRIGWV